MTYLGSSDSGSEVSVHAGEESSRVASEADHGEGPELPLLVMEYSTTEEERDFAALAG